jgi:hypothetical protein
MTIRLTPEKEKQITDLLEKLHRGDGLTDDELDRAISFYSDLEWRLNLLGPRYHFAWWDVRQKLDLFDSFKVSRTQNH